MPPSTWPCARWWEPGCCWNCEWTRRTAPRDDWGELHFAVALTFVGLALVHSALNWAWIKTALRQRKSAFVVVGVGAVFVAVLLLWPADHRAAYDGPEPIRHQTSHD